jgi:hypothetical protein
MLSFFSVVVTRAERGGGGGGGGGGGRQMNPNHCIAYGMKHVLKSSREGQ